MNLMAILLATIAGALLPVQAGVNATLRGSLGAPLWAGLANFLVGGLAILIAAIATAQPFPSLQRAATAPWWAWVGGVCGATLVVASLASVPRLGYLGLAVCIIAGQLTASVVFDHFGLVGLEVRPASVGRILGVGLLIGGVVLVMRS